MINTWLFAAAILIFLALCAVLRIFPGPTLLDRIVAANAAITIASAGGAALCIATGNLLALDITILAALLLYAGTFAISRMKTGGGA